MHRLGRDIPAIAHSRLVLKGIIFVDPAGNVAVLDPQMEKPLGLAQEEQRPPTVYALATDAELEVALEEMLWHYQQKTRVTPKHRSLIERVREAIDRRNGIPPELKRAA